jgi:hypothetical protein
MIGCHSSQVTTLQANRPLRFVLSQTQSDQRFAPSFELVG